MRGLAEPLGALRLTIDPVLTARPPASWSEPAQAEPCAPHGTGTGIAGTGTGAGSARRQRAAGTATP